ncbi:tetratricopeptide repeat protein [Halalkalibacter alkaliphilus]|uniref:Tetratricopeptide repeat protein n=1 Tax=Halalkalibacter alkaliphilus TaxID=2917993 RepID=A0A9X1ZUV5_9BACI|nr:tetratricopeptide repeat protein [Halalkalibacter alkaliphilus]MCL7745924.1 tetratricopeptide repeat protein [Halalkalibacter alkaliphilus]
MNVLEQAISAIESGSVEHGLEQLAKLEKNADHQLKHDIAELYHELGHVEKAKKIIDELLMLYPDEGSLYAFAAELLIDMDEEDEAIEMLLEIKQEDPAFLQAQLLLADLYQMQSLDEVAEQKLLLAAQAAPNETIISYGLGEFYLERGDYIKSIPYLKKAVHASERLPNVHVELLLADAYSASGQFEDALEYYERGLKNHLDPNALFGYGFTAFQVGDMILAIEQLEALMALDPDYSSLYPYLAKAYEAEGRLDDAFETLERGMKIDEFNESLYIHAGKLSFKKQNPVEGETLLRKVIALNPSNVEAVQTLAAYLKHTESYEELLELMEHMREYGEEDSLYTWYGATALKEQDNYEKAYERYREIEEVYKDDIDFLEEYGYFLLEFGMRDQAIPKFKKVIEYQPDREDIVELLENL